MAKRLTRMELKQRTREDLVAAAHRVFLRRGYHQASLDEIAEEAGYTKGAVYSNFEGKDELFLAVLDERMEQRAQEHAAFAVLGGEGIEETAAAIARHYWEVASREPEWQPLLVEFMTHASRDERLRELVRERRERANAQQADLLEEVARRSGLEFLIPAREIVRGMTSLGRGLAVEYLIDPGAVTRELYEHIFVSFVVRATRPSASPRLTLQGRQS